MIIHGDSATCRTCHHTQHSSAFVPYRTSKGYYPDCRSCRTLKRWAKSGNPSAVAQLAGYASPVGAQPVNEEAPEGAADEEITIEEPQVSTVTSTSGYVFNPSVLRTFEAVRRGSEREGAHPLNLMFLGPSGCGKTACGEALAELVGLPFTKVDAAAMTDPESWFGTREVIARDGVSVTAYRPSSFVQAIQKPGVLLIDEVNRVRDEHRNILLPLLDGTHQVTNPLTGEVVRHHPECYVIMSGNRGLQFTGTYAVDPALMTRSLTLHFTYLPAADETRVVIGRIGCDVAVATVIVRFANESRQRTKVDPDMTPISTREVLAACQLVRDGLGIDEAVEVAILNGASDDGGAESVREQLRKIWVGIRPQG